MHISHASLLLGAVVACAATCGCTDTRADANQSAGSGTPAARSRVAMTKALPPLDGSRLVTTVVEVQYGPGESSSAHSHPCPVVGYVVEGAIRSKADDEPEAVYRAGDTFYEAPNGRHSMSANASAHERARFLAFFTCDRDAPLSSPAVPRP